MARQVSIMTPEQVPITYELASVGDRLLALTMDLLAMGLAIGAVWLVTSVAMGGGGGGLPLAFAILASFVLRWFTFIAGELGPRGQTLGKRQLGLRVVARDGGPLTAEMIVARNVAREVEHFMPLYALLAEDLAVPGVPGWVQTLSALWLLGVVMVPFLSRERARIGDLLAGTVVVRTPKAELLPDLLAPTEAAPLTFRPEQLDIYGIHELQVLEDMLRRLDAGAEGDAAAVVADRIRAKIGGTPAQGDAPPEVFLRAFYEAQRQRLEQRLLLGRRQERKVR